MSTGNFVTRIKAQPLSREAYQRYGQLIGASDEHPWRPANMGTSRRFNHLADMQNLRGDKAKLNLCVFSCTAFQPMTLEMALLEKHPYSTQVFVPIDSAAKYLVIVCLGGDEPDLETLSAFVAEGPVGISYHPGIWHYPMTALSRNTDFTCLVYEDDTRDDCIVRKLQHPISIEI